MSFNTATRHIFLYGIGLLSMKVISLLMLPITTKILSPGDFGTLEVLLTFNNLLYIVLGFGLSDAIFRFGGMAKTPQEIEIICHNAASQAFIIGIMLSVPVILLSNKLAPLFPGHVTTLQIFYLGLALIPVNVLQVQMDWLRLKEDVTSFVRINVIRALIQAAMVLLMLLTGYGVTGIMFASVISSYLIFFYVLIIQLNAPLIDYNLAK